MVGSSEDESHCTVWYAWFVLVLGLGSTLHIRVLLALLYMCPCAMIHIMQSCDNCPRDQLVKLGCTSICLPSSQQPEKKTAMLATRNIPEQEGIIHSGHFEPVFCVQMCIVILWRNVGYCIVLGKVPFLCSVALT